MIGRPSVAVVRALALVLLLSSPSAVFGGAAEINRRIGRGLNMGNMLEAPSEGAWGVRLDERDFERIAAQGFCSVRIPIRWSAAGRAGVAPPYAISDTFFRRTDRAVNAALDAGLAVIIDCHHYEEIFDDPDGQRDRFLSIWRQVAAHYRDYPDTLVFEILNEPHGRLTPPKWNSLLAAALRIIRATNSKRTIVVGTAGWGGAASLDSLVIPPGETNVILTIHFYEPFHFTYQGAEWVGPEAQSWLGTTWSGTPEEKAAVAKALQPVKEFSVRSGIPVFIGEFGAYGRADERSREQWTACCARHFEELGFSWAYWEFCSGFGVYDPGAKTWRPGLLDALLGGAR